MLASLYLHCSYARTRNRIGHHSGAFCINVLKEHWDIAKYRATLGHKINHSFTKVNAKYVSGVFHPRFGPILAILAKRKIKKGEELFTSYGYETKDRVPIWFAEAYEDELKEPWPGNKYYH